MRDTRRSLGTLAAALLMYLGEAASPLSAVAQTEPQRGWALVPSIGVATVRDNGNWESAGVESSLDIQYITTRWLWSGSVSLRGVGVGCSHACFDGGPAMTAGLSHSVRSLWIGAGVGAMKNFAEWGMLTYGRVSLAVARLRLDVRIELPQVSGAGAYIPLLVGMPIPLD